MEKNSGHELHLLPPYFVHKLVECRLITDDSNITGGKILFQPIRSHTRLHLMNQFILTFTGLSAMAPGATPALYGQDRTLFYAIYIMNEDRVCGGVNVSVRHVHTIPTSLQIHAGANCGETRAKVQRWDHRGNTLVSLAPKHPHSSHQLKPEQHTENICTVHDSTTMSTPGLNHISRALAGLLKRSFVLRGACFSPHKTSPVTRSVLSVAERKTCSWASLAETEVRRLVMKRYKVGKGRGSQR